MVCPFMVTWARSLDRHLRPKRSLGSQGLGLHNKSSATFRIINPATLGVKGLNRGVQVGACCFVVGSPRATLRSPCRPLPVGVRGRSRPPRRLARNLAFLVGLDAEDNPSGRTSGVSVRQPDGLRAGQGHAPGGERAGGRRHRDRDAPPLRRRDQAAQCWQLPTSSPVRRGHHARRPRCARTSDDGAGCADAVRVTAWASLVATPITRAALFVAAIQARAVQRPATAEWRPSVEQTSVGGSRSGRSTPRFPSSRSTRLCPPPSSASWTA